MARTTQTMRLVLAAMRDGAYASSVGWYVDFVYPEIPHPDFPDLPKRLVRLPEARSACTTQTMDALERRGLVRRVATAQRGALRWEVVS